MKVENVYLGLGSAHLDWGDGSLRKDLGGPEGVWRRH